MNYDLSTMTLPALHALQRRVEQALADYESRKKAQAIRAIVEAAGRHGFTLTDLFGAVVVKKLQQEPAPKARKTAKIKYCNPDNPDQVWTGFGPKPKWLKDRLSTGRSIDDFKV